MPERAAAAEDLELVAALLTTPTIRAAASAAGISESTLYRRLRDPEFRALTKEARYRAFSHALSRLQAATGAAVFALTQILDDPEAPANARVRAATTVLELAARDLEPEHLEERLERDTRAREAAERQAAAAPHLGKDKEAYLAAGGDPFVWDDDEFLRGLASS